MRNKAAFSGSRFNWHSDAEPAESLLNRFLFGRSIVDESIKNRISQSKRLLRNQYAFLEYTEDQDELTGDKQVSTENNRMLPIQNAASSIEEASSTAVEQKSPERPEGSQHKVSRNENPITKNRILLQNPYAYSDGFGGYSATDKNGEIISLSPHPARPASTKSNFQETGFKKPRRSRNQHIELTAHDMRSRLWKNRISLWNGTPPTDPVRIIDPARALHLLGYKFSLDDTLGQFRNDRGEFEVAGLIDPNSKIVRVSRQPPLNVRLFTAAHELGHVLLHPSNGVIHRDRPQDGTTPSRNPRELEADKFASYFLMPAKLVRERFTAAFKTERFISTDDTSFALCCLSLDEFQVKYTTQRSRSRLLASTESYSGRHFTSLATQFRVSVEAMAIRLEELNLLDT